MYIILEEIFEQLLASTQRNINAVLSTVLSSKIPLVKSKTLNSIYR